MKTAKKIRNNLFFSLILILILSSIGFSQTSKPKEEFFDIPNGVMKQIVRKVLIHYFKLRSQMKLILLSDYGIQQSWLPKIKGIEFQLVDTRQDAHRLTGHYKFINPFGDKQSIGFGYGSGSSGYSGDMWSFRVAKQTVKIWKDKDEWGSSGDDYGGSPDIPPPPPPPPMLKKP